MGNPRIPISLVWAATPDVPSFAAMVAQQPVVRGSPDVSSQSPGLVDTGRPVKRQSGSGWHRCFITRCWRRKKTACVGSVTHCLGLWSGCEKWRSTQCMLHFIADDIRKRCNLQLYW